MPTTSPSDKWPSRPFDSTCTDYTDSDEDTRNSIRVILAGWDGNWSAVYEVLRWSGRTPDELKKMSVFDVRMAFATGARPLAAIIGVSVDTAVANLQKPPTPPSKSEMMVFIPGPMQTAILKALEWKAMRSRALAKALKIDQPSLYRQDGLKELIKFGRVKKQRRIGYYRPDAPPPEYAQVLSGS